MENMITGFSLFLAAVLAGHAVESGRWGYALFFSLICLAGAIVAGK